MDQLSSFLHLEVSKYKDINHILKKLEDDGEVKNVFGIFKTIFDTEFDFTLQGKSQLVFSFTQPIRVGQDPKRQERNPQSQETM